MTTIVIGGHSRNIGKTSVAVGLIGAFADRGWTAIKITQYGHGVCSINGKQCGCAAEEHAYAILEEKNQNGHTDSSRFLVAGARRSLWVRTKQGELPTVMPKLRPIIESDPFVIIESNSVVRYIRPALYIMVLKFDVEDFKNSAREFLCKADAAVVVESKLLHPLWKGIWLNLPNNLPMFSATPPDYAPRDLQDFVEVRLKTIQGRGISS